MDVDSVVPDQIPQSEPLEETQVANNAGGYVYQIDDISLLRRFIILGSNGNNYYVSAKKVTLQSTEVVLKLLASGQGQRVIEEVTQISTEGRAPRQTAGIFVLAVCARLGDAPTRAAALAALPAVCRTASTLFEFVQQCKELGSVTRATRTGDAAADPGAVMVWLAQTELAAAAAKEAIDDDAATSDAGQPSDVEEPRAKAVNSDPAKRGKPSWGRSFRRAVSHWYLKKSPVAVAYQVTKYSQRNGWSHADLLRLAHPDPEDFAAKKRERAVVKPAEPTATATEAAADAPSTATTAGAAAEVPQRTSDAGDDWVMVPAAEDDGAAEASGGEGSEQGVLAAAVAAAAAANTASVRDGLMSATEAAEAAFVADMKAIFDFLTHGTVPGQERKQRRGKPKAPAAPEAAVDLPVAASEVPAAAADATEAMEEDKPAAADKVSAAVADDASAGNEASAATDEAAATEPAATAAAPTAPDVVPAIPLSPVMQYIVDAHKLRKIIRAPPPLIKKPKRPKILKRRRSSRPAALPEEPAAPPPEVSEEAVAAHKAATAAAIELAVTLIRRHRFGHEHVGDTALLREPEVWATFLEVGMPLTAMIRNLGRMTQIGVMERSECLRAITTRLRDAAALAKARVHPMSVLEAWCTYRIGRGERGKTSWNSVTDINEALEAAFYLAFKNVEPTGQRYLLGVDVSGSMSCSCSGMTSVQSREAAAAVAMTLVRTEPWVKALAFSHTLVPLHISPEDPLTDVVDRAAAIPMGGTDCALPMIYATERKLPVDVFVVLTDNETWFGNVHPTAALRKYRTVMGQPNAKLVVLAFSTSQFSIADPKDPGMLDVAGLDSAVPRLVADFVTGKL